MKIDCNCVLFEEKKAGVLISIFCHNDEHDLSLFVCVCVCVFPYVLCLPLRTLFMPAIFYFQTAKARTQHNTEREEIKSSFHMHATI